MSKNRFRRLLDELNLTAGEVARRAGVAVQTINAWSCGDRHPSWKFAVKVAKALKIEPAKLVELVNS